MISGRRDETEKVMVCLTRPGLSSRNLVMRHKYEQVILNFLATTSKKRKKKLILIMAFIEASISRTSSFH